MSEFWQRPLGPLEILFYHSGLQGQGLTLHALWLSSSHCIPLQLLQDALQYTVKSFPILQWAVSERSRKLWFKKVPIDVPSILLVSEEDPMKIYHQELKRTFDMKNGPLWSMTFVRQTPSFGSYSYVLLLNVHHCITDVITNVSISKCFISFLKSKLLMLKIPPFERPNHLFVPSGTFNWSIRNVIILIKLILGLLVVAFWNNCNRSWVRRCCSENVQTKVLCFELDEKESANLINICYRNKVTVTSCIAMLINFSIYKLAKEYYSNQLNLYKIKSTVAVNIRRYYPNKVKNACGCHVGLLEMNTSINPDSDFWKSAKQYSDLMKNKLKEQLPMLTLPVRNLGTTFNNTNKFLSQISWYNVTSCHYLVSSMGDMDKLMPEDDTDSCIRISHLMRSVTNEFGANPCTLNIHTFRRKIMISMDYYTTKLPDESATNMFTELKSRLKTLCNNDEL